MYLIITLWPCGQGYIMVYTVTVAIPRIYHDVSLTTVNAKLIALMQADSLLNWVLG